MQYIALLVLAFLQVVLSILLSYKKHLRISRIFLAFSGVLFLWTIANITLDHAYRTSQLDHTDRLSLLNFSNHAGFFMGAITLIFLYRMMRSFPVEIKEDKVSRFVTGLGIFTVLSTLLPAVSGNYVMQNGQPVYEYGSLTAILLIYFAIVAILSVKTVLHAFRKTLNPRVKAQTKTILASLLVTMSAAIFIITILPIIVGDDSFIFLGYFAPYIFTSALFYSIFRQSFLDFRSIVARSLTYILSLSSIGALFIIATYTLTSILFSNADLRDSTVRWLYTFMAAVLALSYVPTKQFFDRITSRIFFRDSYDPQIFLDQFNKLLVATFEVGPLLKSSSEIVSQNLKPTYCSFEIKAPSGHTYKAMGTRGKSTFTEQGVNSLHSMTKNLNSKIVIADELGQKHGELQEVLRKTDTAILAKLTSSVQQEGVGYLLLGPKKSGNPYSAQDIQTIEIITNELVIAIQNALRFEEIKNFNATLQERVEEATRKLRHANDKLKALDETKDDFISMASHQLRTPLTSIKGYLSMVLEGDAGNLNKTQKDMLGQAFTSSQRMVYLIADLLNVSRLKTGKFVIEKSLINLAEVIGQELAQVEQVAEAKGVKLVYDKPKDFPELMIDDTKTRQVVMNIVDNAIYYTPSGGEVRIELADKPTAIELRVSDNGIGVPKSEQHHLFTKFYRAGNARKARPDGTGLGLFMAKKVVVSQGGAIIFESKEGKGSTFGFVFNKRKLEQPIEQPKAKPAPAAERT